MFVIMIIMILLLKILTNLILILIFYDFCINTDRYLCDNMLFALNIQIMISHRASYMILYNKIIYS